jgi:hypothetical protein
MSETNKTLQRWKCHHEYIEPVDGNDYGDWVSYDDASKLLAEVERLRAALQSIAKSTCCDACNEAALVARNALKEDGR